MKACTKCGETFPATVEYFYLKKTRIGTPTLTSWCKPCNREARARHCWEDREAHLQRDREYRERNREEINRKRRAYYRRNPELFRERRRVIDQDPATKAKKVEYMRTWREKNASAVREYHREYQRLHQGEYDKKRYEDPSYRVSRCISSCMRTSLLEGKSGRSWESLVGYTCEELMVHLEAQFTKGMSWDNYGRHGWHIDHIRPIADFNFETPDDPDFKECWSPWNLQPLWASENMRKGAKCEAPPLPLV